MVDEARIWNVARTQAQIQAAKDTDITAAQTGLIGHWGLNEGAGAFANNTFGTAGVNGTLTERPDLGQRVRAGRPPTSGSQLNGTSQYVTFGAAPALGAHQLHPRAVVQAHRRGRRHEHRHGRHRERDPADHEGPRRGARRRPTST